MKYFTELKRIKDDYKTSEILKSVLSGVIFFILILLLIIALTINISFIYIRYMTNFILIASLFASFTSYIAVNLVYITLLNYNNEPTTSNKYTKKINLIVIPVIVFLLGLLPIIFI